MRVENNYLYPDTIGLFDKCSMIVSFELSLLRTNTYLHGVKHLSAFFCCLGDGANAVLCSELPLGLTDLL